MSLVEDLDVKIQLLQIKFKVRAIENNSLVEKCHVQVEPWNVLGYRMPLDGVLKINIRQSLSFEMFFNYLVVKTHHIHSLEMHTISSRKVGDSLFFYMTHLALLNYP